jgi:hypothetical protein
MWEYFRSEVERAFQFLKTQYGFELVSADKPPNVVYESDLLRIFVFYDSSRGGESDLRMRRKSDDPSSPLSLGIAMLCRMETENDIELGRISNRESLHNEVQKLASALAGCGSSLLAGDLSVFSRLEEQEKQLSKKYSRQMH